MLPRDRAQQIIADHAAGKPVRAIARTYGHNPKTVRNYVSGRRTPGEATARSDDFAPFITYCRQRLADDPHLRAAALLAEITSLGFPGTQRTFYRALERHEVQPHPCPDCHIARISGYYPLAPSFAHGPLTCGDDRGGIPARAVDQPKHAQVRETGLAPFVAVTRDIAA